MCSLESLLLYTLGERSIMSAEGASDLNNGIKTIEPNYLLSSAREWWWWWWRWLLLLLLSTGYIKAIVQTGWKWRREIGWYSVYYNHSFLYGTEKESIDDDYCHSTDSKRTRAIEREREKEKNSTRKREREDRCLTSKSDKILLLSFVYVYLIINLIIIIVFLSFVLYLSLIIISARFLLIRG